MEQLKNLSPNWKKCKVLKVAKQTPEEKFPSKDPTRFEGARMKGLHKDKTHEFQRWAGIKSPRFSKAGSCST